MLKTWLTSLWKNPAVLNAWAMVFLLVALTITTIAGTAWLKRHSWFEIKEVVVTGMRGNQDLTHQDPTFVKQTILPKLRGNLFTTDLIAVQNTFAEAPWIRHVAVRRVWPNRLWVVLEEQQTIAKLNETSLVNQQGEVFLGNTEGGWENLPHLYGDPRDVIVMLTRFQELNQWLAPKQLAVRELFFSDRRAWTAVLSNNLVLEIGRDDLQPATQQRVTRWVNTWATAQQAATLPFGARIDLRYPNGYAVSRGTS